MTHKEAWEAIGDFMFGRQFGFMTPNLYEVKEEYRKLENNMNSKSLRDAGY